MSEEQDIKRAMKALGFKDESTGGGLSAYILSLGSHDDPYVMVSTVDEDVVPTRWDQRVGVGRYRQVGDFAGSVSYRTMRQFVRESRAAGGAAGILALVPDGADGKWVEDYQRTPAPPGALDQADIDVINRHRSRIGAAPIDVKAGWTASELGEMAENIRKRGRTHNPSYRERLRGGEAEGMHPSNFDPVQLERGTRVELEHTTDTVEGREIAREIAMDHLAEDSDYYEKLSTIHNPKLKRRLMR